VIRPKMIKFLEILIKVCLLRDRFFATLERPTGFSFFLDDPTRFLGPLPVAVGVNLTLFINRVSFDP